MLNIIVKTVHTINIKWNHINLLGTTSFRLCIYQIILTFRMLHSVILLMIIAVIL